MRGKKRSVEEVYKIDVEMFAVRSLVQAQSHLLLPLGSVYFYPRLGLFPSYPTKILLRTGKNREGTNVSCTCG